MKKKLKSVKVWTWIVDFGKGPELCYFSRATKKDLIADGKPSPEAKPVRVTMRAIQ